MVYIFKFIYILYGLYLQVYLQSIWSISTTLDSLYGKISTILYTVYMVYIYNFSHSLYGRISTILYTVYMLYI